MREDGGSGVQKLLRVPKRFSRRYRERDTYDRSISPSWQRFVNFV